MDQSKEPVNLKMARLRQCLYGSALEAIRGLGVSEPEYEEAKEILIAKFGGSAATTAGLHGPAGENAPNEKQRRSRI